MINLIYEKIIESANVQTYWTARCVCEYLLQLLLIMGESDQTVHFHFIYSLLDEMKVPRSTFWYIHKKNKKLISNNLPQL